MATGSFFITGPLFWHGEFERLKMLIVAPIEKDSAGMFVIPALRAFEVYEISQKVQLLELSDGIFKLSVPSKIHFSIDGANGPGVTVPKFVQPFFAKLPHIATRSLPTSSTFCKVIVTVTCLGVA